MKKLFYLLLVPVLIVLSAGQCQTSSTDCSNCESDLALAKSQLIFYQDNISVLNNSVSLLKTIKDSLQNLVNILIDCPYKLEEANLSLSTITNNLINCEIALKNIRIDTVYVNTTPFILRQNCMFYVVDTFTFGSEMWYIVDMGNEKNDTIQVSYRDKEYFFTVFHFSVDTIINRTNTVFDHNTTPYTKEITALLINAYGSVCEGDYPIMHIYVNDVLFASETVSNPETYIFNLPYGFSNIEKISIQFNNDCWIPATGEDRNLHINSVILNSFELKDQATFVGIGGNYVIEDDEIILLSDCMVEFLLR